MHTLPPAPMPRCYVILRDTLGDGLDTFGYTQLEVIEEKDLDEAVQAAIDQILEEEGAETVKEYKEYLRLKEKFES